MKNCLTFSIGLPLVLLEEKRLLAFNVLPNRELLGGIEEATSILALVVAEVNKLSLVVFTTLETLEWWLPCVRNETI